MDMTSASYFPAEDELLADAMREDAFWEQMCPHRNDAGERCTSTIHLTGPHTWE